MENTNHDAMHQRRYEGDSDRRIELITGIVRRRRWTAAEKSALVAESLQPGINVSALARRRGVSRGLLQTWRRAAMRQSPELGQVFVPLRIDETPTPDSAGRGKSGRELSSAATADSPPRSATGTLEIEGVGMCVRFSGPVDTAALRLVLKHVGSRV
jgi:transposase-like protein